MKIISTLVFAAALIGSWVLVHAKRPISQSVHVGIQNDVKNIIAEYVQKTLPSAQGLMFEKFWTEAISKNKVRATFSYSFEDNSDAAGATVIQVDGSAILSKVSETPELVTWSFDELRIMDNTIEFQEPLHISAEAGELEGQ